MSCGNSATPLRRGRRRRVYPASTGELDRSGDACARADENTAVSRRGLNIPGGSKQLLVCRQVHRLILPLLVLLSGVTPASAQMGGAPMGAGQMGGGHGGRERQQQQATKPTAPVPPTVVVETWPRLEAGAILCQSRDDLVRYQTPTTADPDNAASAQAADCRIIQKRTAIQILDRDGPSRSHVVVTDASSQTGWTNAYLPSKSPASGGTSTAVGH